MKKELKLDGMYLCQEHHEEYVRNKERKIIQMKKKETDMKRKEMKKESVITGIMMILTIAVTIAVIARLYFTSNTYLSATFMDYAPENSMVLYDSYRIQGDDTLTSISNSFINEYEMDVPTDVMVAKICEVNHLSNPDNITYGKYLIIPYIVKS